ncbi:ADP-ribosylation factor GTPase-activating protein 2 [Caerostris darwini]|uniref:ADP-ribosylation factor GTPase-activating protein 2 n=1 Tax=Caerostris darwini TaxID=1538125 RepID=A0AAV4QFF6_9ARAC|nr:ADP-ribosylation factor GTPase-activating protein 2 [Caerostris darwini]
MAEEKPCKNDIAAVFKRLRSITSNKVCFDCGAKNPTWASVTYGVFICMDCSAVHRSLGVHLSFVRSTQLDTNWTWLQLRAMQVGGNSNALVFFQQHGCGSQDAQQKYNSRAAQLYREKLHHQAVSAMRVHGTKVHIDIPHAESPASPEKKECDFFRDMEEAEQYRKDAEHNARYELRNGSCLKNSDSNSNTINSGPKLEVTLDHTPNKSEPKKSTITGRKPVSAKKGMGGKKGLGAQRVVANFDDIEKEAEKLDRLREQAEVEANVELPPEEQEKQFASVRLAYKDLSLEQKKTEEKLRLVNPQKAEQLERLGMGFSGRNVGHVTHSAASEMKLITQETPSSAQKNRDIDGDDDFEFLSLTSGPPKYGDSPFLSRESSYRLNDVTAKGSWINEKMEKRSSSDNLLSKDTSGRARKSASTSNIGNSDEAQKKFGNAKGISSEQFFGPNKDSDFERKANLTKFEGSSSISSDDFFGNDSSRRTASASSYNTPNLYEIKEGVRDGVTRVAGRISSIANGVMSSLQDRYGY